MFTIGSCRQAQFQYWALFPPLFHPIQLEDKESSIFPSVRQPIEEKDIDKKIIKIKKLWCIVLAFVAM